MNLALARSYSATSRWQTLLDSGAVFAVKQRNTLLGTLNVDNKGWVRFGKRKATVTNDIGQVIDANWNFVGVTPSRISDGQGGFLPSTMPAWLDIPAKNDITTQWELVCVYQVDTLTGPISQCDTNLLGVERTRNDRDGTTWLLDPVTDRLYGYQHQTQGSSFQRDNALIRNAWVLIDAGPDSQGLARFVVRQWSNDVNGVWMESEYTQLPLSTVQLAVPGYVPTND